MSFSLEVELLLEDLALSASLARSAGLELAAVEVVAEPLGSCACSAIDDDSCKGQSADRRRRCRFGRANASRQPRDSVGFYNWSLSDGNTRGVGRRRAWQLVEHVGR